MGLSGVSTWELLIILGIVIMLFGTKRLKTLGSDLGGAIKSFRKAMDGKNVDEANTKPVADKSSESAPRTDST